MKRVKELLKKPWFYIILFLASLVIPFVINWAYKCGLNSENTFVTMWGADDVLSFYGSYLSAIGTIVLGIVAIHQNNKASEQTERANELAEQMQRLEQARFVSMVDLTVCQHDMRCQPIDQVKQEKMPARSPGVYMNLAADLSNVAKCYIVDATIANKSEYPIVQIGIHPGKRGNGIAQIFGMKNYQEKATYIPAQGSILLRMAIPSHFLATAQISALSLSIDFTNIFDYKTAATLYLEDFGSMNTPFRSQYRLSKFVDVKPHSEQE